MTEKRFTVEQYKSGILSGDRAVLGRAITLIESSLAKDEALAAKLINSILPFTGKSFRIGISGIPGAGKSTFIEALGTHLIAEQKKVAVLAIDPSSKLSGGSLLGDKTRMNELVRSELAFIRPTPANETLGGVAGKTYETILLCEAAGFDYILIETVGIGQSETEVFSLTDLFLLLMISGMGDELQTMKKGVMELADLILINKADDNNKENALAAAAEIKNTLHIFSNTAAKTSPTVMTCSSKTGEGIDSIATWMEEFRQNAQADGRWGKKRVNSTLHRLYKEIQYNLERDFFNTPSVQKKLKSIENELAEGKLTSHAAALLLLKNYKQKK
jgi:LAO/AO transport system kinase